MINSICYAHAEKNRVNTYCIMFYQRFLFVCGSSVSLSPFHVVYTLQRILPQRERGETVCTSERIDALKHTIHCENNWCTLLFIWSWAQVRFYFIQTINKERLFQHKQYAIVCGKIVHKSLSTNRKKKKCAERIK